MVGVQLYGRGVAFTCVFEERGLVELLCMYIESLLMFERGQLQSLGQNVSDSGVGGMARTRVDYLVGCSGDTVMCIPCRAFGTVQANTTKGYMVRETDRSCVCCGAVERGLLRSTLTCIEAVWSVGKQISREDLEPIQSFGVSPFSCNLPEASSNVIIEFVWHLLVSLTAADPGALCPNT